MKKVILLALFMPCLAYGQIIDNFESGSLNGWSSNAIERWKADPVTPISGTYSLHHIFDNTASGNDRIGKELKNFHPSQDTSEWSFSVHYGYDPSSTNNWMVFLMSDAAPDLISLTGTTSGYAIGVNITGSDDTLRLVKVKNGVLKTVVTTAIKWPAQIGITESGIIKVLRTPAGKWIVTVSKAGTQLSSTFGYDPELFAPSWFAVLYRYTSTLDRLLRIDNVSITGPFYEDTSAPIITGCKPYGKKSVLLSLGEAPDASFIMPDNFTMNTVNTIQGIVKKSNLEYLLTFSGELLNKKVNMLDINNICDALGNCSVNQKISIDPVWAETGDIVISEIMADPLPPVSLPGKEYLEITNRTEYSFILDKWKLRTSDQDYTFPSAQIKKDEILILCASADTTLFKKYGRTIGLKQFPVLTDGGKAIILADSTGTIINGVEYSSLWYGETLKKDGGWSLELADLAYPFYAAGNWKASVSTAGGTPGMYNSVRKSNPDSYFEGLINVFAVDGHTLTVRFSEPVIDFEKLAGAITAGGMGVEKITPSDLLYREFTIKTLEELIAGKEYVFEISGELKDFAGNPAVNKNQKFALAEKAVAGDLLFNEILFNPLPGDEDFIEFYNPSTKAIDASRMYIVSVSESGDTSQLYQLSPAARCIMPGTYFAITTAREKIISRYPKSSPEAIFEIPYLPSMPDDKGHLVLYNRELEKIDELYYSEQMQNPLLPDFDGISLEKSNPILESMTILNWHSCNAGSGYGTPGSSNSENPVNDDHSAPEIKSFNVSGKNSVTIMLSEPPDDTFLYPENFKMSPAVLHVLEVRKVKQTEFIIRFSGSFVNKDTNKLEIERLCDMAGNFKEKSRISFFPVWAETGDVVISEIMADPLPPVSLPGNEYLEITNRTQYSFNLDKWKLRTSDQDYTFPSAQIKKDEILILCASADTALFKKYGRAIGLKQFPVLTDGGKAIMLTDSTGTIINGVEYSSRWYGETLKKDGGWSLELADLAYPFYAEGNWKASVSTAGGTPGMYNSVRKSNPDSYFEGLVNVFAVDGHTLTVRFSEPVIDFEKLAGTITAGGMGVEKITPSDLLYRDFTIKTLEEFIAGKEYVFEISGELKDFAGNPAMKKEYKFSLAEKAAKGDILFNEILFNPLPGDEDYIEFYNPSLKAIDASRMYIASVSESGDTSQLYQLSPAAWCIMPGTYFAVTTAREKIISRYPNASAEAIFEIPYLPSMPDDKGHLVLYNRELEKIDEFSYDEKMHYSLLSGCEGVSLEKINPASESLSVSNWHSAAESSFWGTPGTQNSVYSEKSEDSGIISFSSTRITPDADGNEDFLTIGIHCGETGTVISITIFDEAGNYVKRLASNLLAAPDTSFIWDGTSDDGNAVRNGIYVFLITAYDDRGNTNSWKKVCTVVRR
ncbi:MAG: lamin tail domain-containing protein [Methanosarcina sp.]